MYSEYLILGSGAAGISAAMAIREKKPKAQITILSDERTMPCIRPLLTKASLQAPLDEYIYMVDKNWADEQDISFSLQSRVLALKPEAHEVITDQGEPWQYGTCIYALGSSARRLSIAGSSLQGVFTIRTIADVEAIRRYALAAKTAVIIGGGVIGMEAAEQLTGWGIRVTVLEAQSRLLPRILGEEISERYRKMLRLHEVKVNVHVDSIIGKEKAEGVMINGGELIPCDFVIMSCGVFSNLEPLKKSGIQVNRGVLVDEHMRTSDKDVYACGDCTEYMGRCIALWKYALDQGRTAGLSACGESDPFIPEPLPVMFYSAEGASLFAIGNTDQEKNGHVEEYEINGGPYQMIYGESPKGFARKVYTESGKLTGAVLLGNLTEMQDILRQLPEN